MKDKFLRTKENEIKHLHPTMTVVNAKFCRQLEEENNKLRKILEQISNYDKASKYGEGICPYGCDCPEIAKRALEELNE